MYNLEEEKRDSSKRNFSVNEHDDDQVNLKGTVMDDLNILNMSKIE